MRRGYLQYPEVPHLNGPVSSSSSWSAEKKLSTAVSQEHVGILSGYSSRACRMCWPFDWLLVSDTAHLLSLKTFHVPGQGVNHMSMGSPLSDNWLHPVVVKQLTIPTGHYGPLLYLRMIHPWGQMHLHKNQTNRWTNFTNHFGRLPPGA